MSNAFPLFVERKARGWFQNLQSGSIHSFQELSKQFLSRFFQRKKLTKMVADLMNIHRGKDETLQAYVDRFNDESQVVISAFMNGLNPGKLYTHKVLRRALEIFCNVYSSFKRAKMLIEEKGKTTKQRRKWMRNLKLVVLLAELECMIGT